ncbi:hypothetical protein ACN47E_002830 [Coniothyrium glycines]
MSTSSNRSLRIESTIRTAKRLVAYNITFDRGTPFPDELAPFVEMLESPREAPQSPHAQAVVNKRRAALWQNESTGRKMLEQHLLFHGQAHLTLKDQVDLVRDFLPPPPQPTVPDFWGTLARPQPDSCIGYITATEAKMHNPPLPMPFTQREDDIAEFYNVVHHSDTHFPFLTAQWKAAMSGENQIHASLQAARDGALIVNYMHQFYSTAYPNRNPSQLYTCHVSLTTDMLTTSLWLHWREVDSVDKQVYYRMERIHSAHLHEVEELAVTRNMLHNYINYALKQRLASIKAALVPFWDNCSATRKETVTKLNSFDKSKPVV